MFFNGMFVRKRGLGEQKYVLLRRMSPRHAVGAVGRLLDTTVCTRLSLICMPLDY